MEISMVFYVHNVFSKNELINDLMMTIETCVLHYFELYLVVLKGLFAVCFFVSV